MVERFTRLVAVFFAAASPALITACTDKAETVVNETINQIPIIRTKLGDSIAVVHDRSTAAFSIVNSDDRPIPFTTATRLKYTESGHEFELPPALFLWLDVRSEHVVEIKVSPHLSYLQLDDAVALYALLLDRINTANWQPSTERSPQSPEKVKSRFSDAQLPVKFADVIAMWHVGTSTLDITLKRKPRLDVGADVDKSLASPAYTLDILIHDEVVRDQYDRD